MSDDTFQARVQPWMLECFGEMIASDREERNHRFLEEALELVQACGASLREALSLVFYVYGRPAGERDQEVGGVMVTLAALCLAQDLDMHAAGETELTRISDPVTIARIRAKQAAKPKHSALPIATAVGQNHRAILGVIDERRRQVEVEGWTPEHDDLHVGGELARAAAAYALASTRTEGQRSKISGIYSLRNDMQLDEVWAFARSAWKLKDGRRDLERAAALILAEIERLDRAALAHPTTGDHGQ